MHIQIVNFQLLNMTVAEYESVCAQLAPQFVAMPGLISKQWLADPATNTFGGVYTWRSRADCEAYKSSALFKSVAAHPNLTNLSSREFGVLEDVTRLTRGAAAHASTA